jgi:hypothetical protein
MLIEGLEFFVKTNSARIWNIASYHSPHSLTWRWILSFSLHRSDEHRVWPIFAPWRDNNGLQWMLRIPFVGYFSWKQQRPMWFRDLYRDARDEQDRKTWEQWLARAQARNAPQPNADGSNAVH